jgi:ribosomal protein L13
MKLGKRRKLERGRGSTISGKRSTRKRYYRERKVIHNFTVIMKRETDREGRREIRRMIARHKRILNRLEAKLRIRKVANT